MGLHESQWPLVSACTALLAHRAVDLLVAWVVAQALTAPHRHVLLLLQCLRYRTLPTWDLDLQPLEEASVGPVRETPAPVALLRPCALGATPPLVVGAVALPTATGVRGVMEPWHLEGSPQPKPQGCIRW